MCNRAISTSLIQTLVRSQKETVFQKGNKMSTTAIVNYTGISQANFDLKETMIRLAGGRHILTRSEVRHFSHMASKEHNRVMTWSPQWIAQNIAAKVKNEDGTIKRGFYDLSVFHVEEKPRKVKAEKPSKLLAEVIDATASMAATVESEQLLNEVLAQTETPEVVEVAAEPIEAPAKLNRKAKRAAKKAAAEATE